VNLSYLREMGRLGYRLDRVEALVVQRDSWRHSAVHPRPRRQGLTRLSSDDLLQARDHGVTPEYVSKLGALGYRSLALEQLITLRTTG